MGQGWYTMIGLGTAQPIQCPKGMDEDTREVVDYELFRDVAQSAKCRTPYTAIPLAVSDGFLADVWNALLMGGDNGVWRVSELMTALAERATIAQGVWTSLQLRAAAYGVVVPDAELLILQDFD